MTLLARLNALATKVIFSNFPTLLTVIALL